MAAADDPQRPAASAPAAADDPQRQGRLVRCALAIAMIFLSGGAVYGWPSMRQMGLVPRDILNTGPLTASQYSSDHFLSRVEIKADALKISSEERMRESKELLEQIISVLRSRVKPVPLYKIHA